MSLHPVPAQLVSTSTSIGAPAGTHQDEVERQKKKPHQASTLLRWTVGTLNFRSRRGDLLDQEK